MFASPQLSKPGPAILSNRETRFRSAATTVLEPSTGTWAIEGSSFHWGLAGDVPILADFDGDGIVDPSVLRRADSTVWIHFSGGQRDLTVAVSGAANPSVTDDFDGDGKDDLAWVEVQDRQLLWTVQSSSGRPPKTFLLGKASDVVMSIDFNGDGKAEPAALSIRANKRWLSIRGKAGVMVGSPKALVFAVPTTDKPDQIFIWEPSTGEWFQHSSGGNKSLGFFGKQPAVPIPADYDRNGSIDKAIWSSRMRTGVFIPTNGSGTKSISYGQAANIKYPGETFPLLATLVR
jgi:hypothetical protein